MRSSFGLRLVFAASVLFSLGVPASARAGSETNAEIAPDDPEPERQALHEAIDRPSTYRLTPPPPRPFRPQPILLDLGIAAFATGYGGAALAALPSTAGLAGRAIYFVGTAGLGALFSCVLGKTHLDEHDHEVGPDNYVCAGQHGAMQLLVPFAGPLLFWKNHPHDSLLNPNGHPIDAWTLPLLYASGGLQVAGAALILASVAAGGRDAPQDASRSGAAHPMTARRFSIAPQLSPTHAGIAFTMGGW